MQPFQIQLITETERTVLLVGSWTPFGAAGSDAPAQMEFALTSLQNAPAGVWLAMDNRLWDPDTTEKVEYAPGCFRLVETKAQKDSVRLTTNYATKSIHS